MPKRGKMTKTLGITTLFLISAFAWAAQAGGGPLVAATAASNAKANAKAGANASPTLNAPSSPSLSSETDTTSIVIPAAPSVPTAGTYGMKSEGFSSPIFAHTKTEVDPFHRLRDQKREACADARAAPNVQRLAVACMNLRIRLAETDFMEPQVVVIREEQAE